MSTSVPTVTQPGSRQDAMASAEASSISRIIIGVAKTIGMPATKCPTVRSLGTIRLRSALMPTLMTSRASMDDAIALLLRGGGALDEGLAALHLVGERRFVDLDHDSIGIDAKILHQRLRDIAHHAVLLLIGAAGGHADGDFGHFLSPFS